MVSPADSENNLIITVLSGSRSSANRLELFGSRDTLKYMNNYMFLCNFC